jgi:multidrug resistance efflux pump
MIKTIGIIIVASLLGGVSFWKFFPSKTVKQYSLVEVQKKDFNIRLIEKGIVQPSNISLVQTFTSGTIISLKEEGEMVKKGDVVARIDTSNYDDDIAELDVKLLSQLLSLDIAKKRVKMIESLELNRMSEKKKSWEYHKVLRDYEFSLPDKKTERQLEITLELKKLDLEESEANLKRQKNLFDKGFLSKSSLETYERRHLTAIEKVKESKLNISISQKGIIKERRVELDQKVLRTRESMDRAEKRMLRRVSEYNDIVKVVEQKIAEMTFRKNNLTKKLTKSTCYAEQDGFFQIKRYKDYRAGGQYVTYAPGVGIRERDLIADIIDPSKMRIDMIFNESDYHLLKVGLDVEIRFPSYPKKVYNGKLTSIGAIGKDRNLWLKELSGSSGVAMYNGEVEFTTEKKLNPGMSAICTVIVDRKTQGLTIPREALIVEKSKFFVFRDETKIEVEGRYISELEFEITKGLNFKDTIRIYRELAE